MAGRRALRGARGGSRNAFTVGNGHHPGRRRERGRSRETGPSRGYLAPAGGARRRRSQLAGRGEAGHGPSISYMEGPCLILPGRNVIARARTPAGAGMPAAMIGGPAEHGRGSPAAAPGRRQ